MLSKVILEPKGKKLPHDCGISGYLAFFTYQWRKIITDHGALSIVKMGYKIPFKELPPSKFFPSPVPKDSHKNLCRRPYSISWIFGLWNQFQYTNVVRGYTPYFFWSQKIV